MTRGGSTADPHRAAYTSRVCFGPTVPNFWVFNPAYAQVQNEHVWQTAWADIMQTGRRRRRPQRRRSSGSRRSSRNIRSRRLRIDSGPDRTTGSERDRKETMTILTRRSVLRGSWRWPRPGLGAALYRQCRGDDRDGVVDPGLRPGGRRRVQEDGRGLREGERQHDRLQHHAIRAASARRSSRQ